MSITVADLQNNLDKYIKLSKTEDVFITDGTAVIAKLTNPYQNRIDLAKSLFGILPPDVTLEQAKEERYFRY